MTMQEFIRQHKISMTVDYADSNPNMPADDKWMATAHHYKCVLRCGKHRMTVPFSQGSAHTSEPDVADVLDCLASDASGVVNAQDFEDWCMEYGYDTDSRKAERTYNVCKMQARKLQELVGPQAYETLLYNTERL